MLYTDCIRIWSIIWDHDRLSREIAATAISMKGATKGAVPLGLDEQLAHDVNSLRMAIAKGGTSAVPRLLQSNSTPSPADRGDVNLPRVYSTMDQTMREVHLQREDLKAVHPQANPAANSYTVCKFFSFDDVLVQSISQRPSDDPNDVDFPFQLEAEEDKIVRSQFDAAMLLLGRSGTGKTTSSVLRLFS